MDSEVTLNELLAEPIIRLLMRRDGVEEQELRDLAERFRLQSETDRSTWPRDREACDKAP